MENLYVELFNWLSKASFDFRNSYQGAVVKWAFIVYCLVLIASILIVVRKHPSLLDYATYGGKRKKRLEKEEKKKVVPRTPWERIGAKLNSVNPNDWKVAVIEADKLFDEALRAAGVPGNTMGDRLKNVVSADMGDNLEGIWEAHKTRNAVVHSPDFELTNEVARKAAGVLEAASKALEAK